MSTDFWASTKISPYLVCPQRKYQQKPTCGFVLSRICTIFAAMQATTDFLYQVFDTYNKRCFNSQLKHPRIILYNAKRQLGQFSQTGPTPTIKVSNYYDRSEADYIDTMVHEMIHYYIASNHLQDNCAHGKLFRTLMKKINEQEHLHISVRTSSSQWQPACSNRKPHDVLFVHLRNGRHVISVVTPSYVSRIEKQLQMLSHQIISRRWFRTDLPEYDRYAAVRSLRGRLVDEQEFNSQMERLEALSANRDAQNDTP